MIRVAAVRAIVSASTWLLVLVCTSAVAGRVPDIDALRERVAQDARVLQDWPALARYRVENEALAPPVTNAPRVVFFGDSITDFWGRSVGTFFPGKPWVNRGISGQTTAQMLLRFRADVIDLAPKAVVILAGTNDIAGNTGPATNADIEDNLTSMAELARANGVRVVLASLLPVTDAHDRQTVARPPSRIVALNDWLEAYCLRSGCVYLDYYGAMVDDHGMLQAGLTDDGLHPNTRGYAVMQPLAEAAVARALADSPDR